MADPVEMARMYNAAGADELVFYDITASFEGRALFTDILTRVASEIFIPLTVGGGINTLEDFDQELVSKGKLTPVFFGSALTNFGVETFLEHFLKMTTSPLPRVSYPLPPRIGARHATD